VQVQSDMPSVLLGDKRSTEYGETSALEEKRNQRVLYSKPESQDDGAGARHALEHVFAAATFLDLSKLTSSSQS